MLLTIRFTFILTYFKMHILSNDACVLSDMTRVIALSTYVEALFTSVSILLLFNALIGVYVNKNNQ